MTIIPKQQALQRWDTLPEEFREVLASEHSVEVITRIAESEHIKEERILEISRLAGYVFMGFLHAEELGHELQEALQIDIKIAENISKALNSRLFAPYKAQLEKIYAPIGQGNKNEINLKIEGSTSRKVKLEEKVMPKIMPGTIREEVESKTAKQTPDNRPAPGVTPKLPSQVQETTKPAPKIIDEVQKIRPIDLKSGFLSVREMPLPPRPPLAPTPTSIKPASEIKPEIKPVAQQKNQFGDSFGIVEEIKKLEKSGEELIDVLKKREEEEVKSFVPPPTNLAGPKILHQESETKPIRPGADFKLEFSPKKFADPMMEERNKPARIEIRGFNLEKKDETSSRSDVIKAPKVVHYSTYQTPVERPPVMPTKVAPITGTPKSFFNNNSQNTTQKPTQNISPETPLVIKQVNYLEEKDSASLSKPSFVPKKPEIVPPILKTESIKPAGPQKELNKNVNLSEGNIDLENLKKV